VIRRGILFTQKNDTKTTNTRTHSFQNNPELSNRILRKENSHVVPSVGGNDTIFSPPPPHLKNKIFGAQNCEVSGKSYAEWSVINSVLRPKNSLINKVKHKIDRFTNRALAKI